MKLGKRQIRMFTLMGINITLFYYMSKFINTGVNFSDGILVGFLMAFVLMCSLGILYTFGEMVYLNFKARMK